MKEEDELEKQIKREEKRKRDMEGLRLYTQSSDPYYNALENIKLGAIAYKNLKIPDSRNERPQSISSVKESNRRRRINAIETISLFKNDERSHERPKVSEIMINEPRKPILEFKGTIDIDRIRREALICKYKFDK